MACEDVQVDCSTHQNPQFLVDRMGARPGAGHLAGWAAFDTNRNLLTKMVALGFMKQIKSSGSKPIQFSLGVKKKKKTGDTSVVTLLSPPTQE